MAPLGRRCIHTARADAAEQVSTGSTGHGASQRLCKAKLGVSGASGPFQNPLLAERHGDCARCHSSAPCLAAQAAGDAGGVPAHLAEARVADLLWAADSSSQVKLHAVAWSATAVRAAQAAGQFYCKAAYCRACMPEAPAPGRCLLAPSCCTVTRVSPQPRSARSLA